MKVIPYFYNSPVVILLLSFFTCGLYHIYWNYQMARVINGLSGREVISPVAGLLCGCCLPLNIYFYYSIGDAIPAIGKKAGLFIENKGFLLIALSIFFPMVSAMIVQGDVNNIYEKTGQTADLITD